MHRFKTTDYFAYTRTTADRAAFQDEWIVLAIEHPMVEAVQGHGRIRRGTYTSEVDATCG